jgi:glyoxylase-like metal-dependent hydrolase (beta-lactamase superfamily II)
LKRLHRKDLFSWSVFNERLDIDFNGFLWTRPDGNVLIDPLPLSPHDREQLDSLGGAAWIVVTNSAHLRASVELAAALGASIAGPAGEKASFPAKCDRWLADGDELVPGATALELSGSKTPGELALWLEPDTLVFGDLVRSHRAGSLTFLLAEQGLQSLPGAKASIQKLLARHPQALLVGDGFSIYQDAERYLAALCSQ